MLSHVIIAGAGIGGLTLAAALRRRGVRTTVLERAASLGPVGAQLVGDGEPRYRTRRP